jgi:hypothetical protein
LGFSNMPGSRPVVDSSGLLNIVDRRVERMAWLQFRRLTSDFCDLVPRG